MQNRLYEDRRILNEKSSQAEFHEHLSKAAGVRCEPPG